VKKGLNTNQQSNVVRKRDDEKSFSSTCLAKEMMKKDLETM
jgi:hypothetical protein